MVGYNFNFVVVMFNVFASIHIYSTDAQTSYVIGDALGWTIPAGGDAVYTTWASLRTFMVGDSLIFNFTGGKQDVAEVSAVAYGSCTFANPITVVNSPASITLTTTGNHYYVCTLASHCKKGQKLSINVFSADGTIPALMEPITPQTPGLLPTTTASAPVSDTPYPPNSSPSSRPTIPPTVTSVGGTTPAAGPPTSGAPSFKAMVPANFLVIGFSFVCWIIKFLRLS